MVMFVLIEERGDVLCGWWLLAGMGFGEALRTVLAVVVVVAATVVRLVIVFQIAFLLRLALYVVVLVAAAATLVGRC